MKNLFKLIFILILFFLIIIYVLFINKGLEYYLLPITERFFSPYHNLLKPGGTLGHAYGIIGSLLMTIGVSVYILRKRVKKFSNWGELKHWLEFHIFMCTIGPLLILFHTSFKFNGLVSISFWSMVIVVLSGFLGRFIYVRIPRTIQGKELDSEELQNLENNYSQLLSDNLKSQRQIINKVDDFINKEKQNKLTAFNFISTIFKDFLSYHKLIKEIKYFLNTSGFDNKSQKEILKVLKKKITLSRTISRLETLRDLLHYWHVFHIPLAIIMFLIMFVHIGISIAFGYKWIF